jgi:hypothetical protein
MRRASIPGDLLLSSLACALAVVYGASASAENGKAVPEPDWIPGFSAGIEVSNRKSQDVVQNFVDPPFWETSEENAIQQYVFTLGAEIAGPAARSIPGRPRLVVGGGIGLVVPTEDRLHHIGQPANATEPERDIGGILARYSRPQCQVNPQNCPNVDVNDDIDGQGSDIRLSFDTVSWHADLGVSFDVPIRDASIVQIRPSLTYRGERSKLQGRLTTVTLDPLLIGPGLTESDFEIFRSRPGAKNTVHHHLGPRLELGLVLSPDARPIRTVFYVHGSYLWLLNDPEEELMDAGGIAFFSSEREERAFRGGIGVRFDWMGFHAR